VRLWASVEAAVKYAKMFKEEDFTLVHITVTIVPHVKAAKAAAAAKREEYLS